LQRAGCSPRPTFASIQLGRETLTRAIVRRPGVDFAAGITTANLGAPSFERLCAQHEAYVAALRRAGMDAELLDPLPGCPDAYFVEDVAVVLDEIAVVTRPGAMPRRGEAIAMEPVLARHREIARIEAPGTVDGGDVLLAGRRAFVGLSQRTNRAGAEQLGGILAAHGFGWSVVAVGEGLHLKSSVNAVSDNTLVVVEGFQREPFAGFRLLTVPLNEAYAANTLRVNDVILTPAGFPRSRELLETLAVPVVELDMSEARKMDGGLTCMSLRFAGTRQQQSMQRPPGSPRRSPSSRSGTP
jgi:dimethylargininase